MANEKSGATAPEPLPLEMQLDLCRRKIAAQQALINRLSDDLTGAMADREFYAASARSANDELAKVPAALEERASEINALREQVQRAQEQINALPQCAATPTEME